MDIDEVSTIAVERSGVLALRSELPRESLRVPICADCREEALCLRERAPARAGVAHEARERGALDEHERAVARRARPLDEPRGAVQRVRDRARGLGVLGREEDASERAS